jgi:hypothetical protein
VFCSDRLGFDESSPAFNTEVIFGSGVLDNASNALINNKLDARSGAVER